jgi:regulation of enolase protein 1 (concanavalin A-like superfamily)
MSETIQLAPLPTPLRWEVPPEQWRAGGPTLTITAGARTDLFLDPQGTAEFLNAPRLLGPIQGDFLLSARVDVAFESTFDAGVLLVYAHERLWAKLCFEYSPQGQPMVVSVVTRGVSDDANAFVVEGRQVWLRVARMGPAYAFHASTDGQAWQFIRHFALGADGLIAVGFLAQSPTGAGCTASFDEVRFATERLRDIRDGS